MPSSFDNLKNSAIATGIAEVLTLPICTIKTNYQNSSSTSIKCTTQSIYNKSGIKGFYKASFPAISSQIFSTTTKYVFYQWLNDQNYKYNNKVTNGIAAGIMSSLMTHPIDMIKIYRQMNTNFKPEIKKYGPMVFYRGYSKTFGKILLSSALFFPLYDMYYEKTSNAIVSSFGSAVTSTLIMHPVDYLKTRHIYNLPLYQGFNPKIYYKGLSLNLLRIVPHFMIVMTIIDYLKNNKN